MRARLVTLLVFLAFLAAGCVNNPAASPTPGQAIAATPSPSPQAQAAASAAASGSFLPYDGGAYAIQYPRGWAVQENQGVVLFQSPASGPDDAFQENVNVLTVPAEQTIDAFVEAVLGPSTESAGFELIDSAETTLSGQPARKIIYSEQSAEAKLKYLQVISVQGGLATIITYAATAATYAEFKDAAEAMVSSFQLKTRAQASILAPAESSMAPEIVRKWRVYSQAIYYDAGGWDYLDTPATTLLEIKADQTWAFGPTASGTWSVQPIQEEDWQKWGVPSYGPTRKLVLNGWNGETNDGPIEGGSKSVDFMWIIYRVAPPASSAPGQIQMKFGRTYG